MTKLDETLEQTSRDVTSPESGEPGIVVIVDAGKPSQKCLSVPRSGLTLGRGLPDGVLESDDRVSRRHVTIGCAQGSWAVNDLDSRNGTFVNGELITGYVDFDVPVLVRLGRSLIWAVDDIAPFSGAPLQGVSADMPVLGGLLHRAWKQIAIASRAGDTLLLRGESGCGKELAARHLHELCFGADSDAPFVAVNCATIPEGLAERLLFGAKRGAYSGATADSRGYIAAAHQGTLFLDEIAELDLRVQAKLLRVLETREIMPLGESRVHRVQLRVCAATHANLRDEVAAGRFREDLYFRLGRPEVVLPPLRQRLDELPWLIAREARRMHPGCSASAGFIEACALRHWSGNVRELVSEVRLAAHAALDAGSSSIEAHHLSAGAGQLVLESSASCAPTRAPHANVDMERIERALSTHEGNVTRAARALGLHRNQLRRWLAKRAAAAAPDED